MNERKVKFKPEILKYLRKQWSVDTSWIRVHGYDCAPQSYAKIFDVPYIVVDDSFPSRDMYSIIKPFDLSMYVISKSHTIPYNDEDLISIDYTLFD